MGSPCEQAHMSVDFFEKTFLANFFSLRVQKFTHWQQVHSSVINEKHNFHLAYYLTNILKINIFIKRMRCRVIACVKSARSGFTSLDLPPKILYA